MNMARYHSAKQIASEIVKQGGISKIQCKEGSLNAHVEQSHLAWAQNYDRETQNMTAVSIRAARDEVANMVANIIGDVLKG